MASMIGFDGQKKREGYLSCNNTRDTGPRFKVILENGMGGRGVLSNVVSRKQKVRKTYSNLNQHAGKVLITRVREGFQRPVDACKELSLP